MKLKTSNPADWKPTGLLAYIHEREPNKGYQIKTKTPKHLELT